MVKKKSQKKQLVLEGFEFPNLQTKETNMKMNKVVFLKKRRTYERNRMKNDVWFKATKTTRSLVSQRLRKAISTGKVFNNGTYFKEIIGIDFKGFYSHIEKQVLSFGWSMSDYGTIWELDHLIPICEYADLLDTQGVDRVIKLAFHYSNYRPLSIAENRNHSLKPAVIKSILTRKTKLAA